MAFSEYDAEMLDTQIYVDGFSGLHSSLDNFGQLLFIPGGKKGNKVDQVDQNSWVKDVKFFDFGRKWELWTCWTGFFVFSGGIKWSCPNTLIL